jgi:excisionase family DNA binding protein
MSSRARNSDVAEGHIVPPISSLDGPLLRPEEAAALLSVKTSWVYDAVRTGKLPCLRVGRHIRFTRGMLEEWLLRVTYGQGRLRTPSRLPKPSLHIDL